VVFNMGNKPVAAASSTKPVKDTTAPVAPIKQTVTIEHCNKGQCRNLVAELSHYNPDILPEWEAGKQAIRYRKDDDGNVVKELTISADALAWIEAEAITYRASR